MNGPSAGRLALRALPFSFVLYVFEALIALLATLPSALQVGSAFGFGRWDQTGAARALDAAFDLAPLLRSAAGSGLLALLLLALFSPWLQMSWFAALSEARSPFAALSAGARLTLRACLVSLWILLVTLLAALPFVLAAFFTHRAVAHSVDARVHDLLVLATLAPVPVLFAVAWLVHDLARGSALRFGSLSSVRRALPMVLRGRVWLRALSLSAAGYAAIALAALQSEWMPPHALRFVWVALALQCALFGRTFLRSLWLASVVTCMLPEPLASAATENTRGLWSE